MKEKFTIIKQFSFDLNTGFKQSQNRQRKFGWFNTTDFDYEVMS